MIIPGHKDSEEGTELESEIEYEPGAWEPEDVDPASIPGKDMMGDEGSGGGYGRPREIDDEDEGKHV